MSSIAKLFTVPVESIELGRQKGSVSYGAPYATEQDMLAQFIPCEGLRPMKASSLHSDGVEKP